MPDKPKARTAGLSTERVDGELVIYDEASLTAHCLSSDAARVFEHCDGERSVTELALVLGMDPGTVERAIEQLAESGLLEASGYSRREAAKRFAQVGGAAFAAPLVYSVAIPAAAAAASCASGTFACGANCCTSGSQQCCGTSTCCATNKGCNGATCTGGGNCCSGVCTGGKCVGPA